MESRTVPRHSDATKPLKSHSAGRELIAFVTNGGTAFDSEADELMGQTDCPHGCFVEPDGICPHNFLSAGRSVGLV